MGRLLSFPGVAGFACTCIQLLCSPFICFYPLQPLCELILVWGAEVFVEEGVIGLVVERCFLLLLNFFFLLLIFDLVVVYWLVAL